MDSYKDIDNFEVLLQIFMYYFYICVLFVIKYLYKL